MFPAKVRFFGIENYCRFGLKSSSIAGERRVENEKIGHRDIINSNLLVDVRAVSS